MTEARAPHIVEPTRGLSALVVAWGIVGVPLAWGVYQTIVKSMALFR